MLEVQVEDQVVEVLDGFLHCRSGRAGFLVIDLFHAGQQAVESLI